MKPVHFHCPNCGQKMQCAEQDATHDVKCGICGQAFVPIVEERIPAWKNRPRLARFHCPNCREKIKAGAEVQGQEIQCPTCQFKFVPSIEEIIEEAQPPPLPPEEPKGGIIFAKTADPAASPASYPIQDAKIRELQSTARLLSSTGSVLFLLSIVAALLFWPAAVGLVFFSIAIKCLAELKHIRANTEK